MGNNNQEVQEQEPGPNPYSDQDERLPQDEEVSE